MYFESKYNISIYKDNEIRFCVVVPSRERKNSGLYLRNLNSIFMQDYNNYHVVYIDDASVDNITEYVKCYALTHQIPV
jgi:glycosyltransferase involved in cell wall biosynthesis